MRVLLGNKYYREGAGAETVAMQTSQLLTAAGHTVIPFGMREPGQEHLPGREYFAPHREYTSGSVVRRSMDTLATVYSLGARRAVLRLVDAEDPDVAHLHNIYHQLTMSIVDGLSARSVPMVLTLHDYKIGCPNYQLYTHGEICERCLDGGYWNAVRHRCLKGSVPASFVAAVEAYFVRWRRLFDRIDVVVAPSEYVATVAERSGISPSRIRVVRNAVAASGRGGDPRARRAKFVFAGRIAPEKGWRVLAEAVRSMPSGVETVVVGDGPDLDMFRESVGDSLGAVRFTGSVTRDAVRAELRNALAVVVPSVWPENCPLVVLEAAAEGTSVIGSAVGGMPELISDGRTGILIRPGDSDALAAAMLRLVRDPKAADELGKAAWDRVRSRHSLPGYLDAVCEAYGVARRGSTSRPGVSA